MEYQQQQSQVANYQDLELINKQNTFNTNTDTPQGEIHKSNEQQPEAWWRRFLRLVFVYAFDPLVKGIFYGSGYLVGKVLFRYNWMLFYKQITALRQQ
ncbi:UNKNOWN [Stylonychia lemnae]|uniref:Uncharacterized protein n=1 Tax=Stylonychia lemnae TaxID=5949 RepID=A0A078A588_STYLE|nr:UNKNOWN [Stylonychia lemnae]|eukprot:CDW75914.1 UNKNOWN [Stylonychia lemnae]